MATRWQALVVLAAATLVATPALAQPGHGRGGGMAMSSGFSSTGNPPGFSHGNKHGWQGASVPPGWNKGKKKGWNGGTMPPGLARRTTG